MKSTRDIHYFELDRPDFANAFDLATAENLLKAVKLAEKQKAAGLIIFTQNPKVFCSGGDLKAYSKMKNPNQGKLVNRKIREILKYLTNSNVLSLAAVGGDCVGGGVELALSCDFIICSAHARFRLAQIYLGLSPGWGGFKNIFRKVNYSTALDLLTTGRWIGGHEAYLKGLVDRISTSESLLKDCKDLLIQTSSHDGDVLKGIKRAALNSGQSEEKLFDSLWGKGVHKSKMANLKNILGK